MLPPRTFGLALSLNVLDCVPSPHDHLLTLAASLRSGAAAIIATPL